MKNQSLSASVLIVDDDEIKRERANDALTGAGFEVLFAENGRLAVKAIEKYRPDIILTDVVMQEMNGFETAIAVHRLPFTRRLPS